MILSQPDLGEKFFKMIIFKKLRIFIFLILSFSTYTFAADADCPENPSVCSDKGICYYATKMNNGNKIWDLLGAGKNHVKEAKNR